MKKMMIALVVMLTIAASGKAMSYEQARNEALFLTDKMAYELNLTDEQYEAAYEINLDYLMGVTSYDDVYATYWERRNLDMSYILLDWQWNAFCAATYFYRPLYWEGGFWHFGIYARYPHRDYFFFGRPVFYASYRGGHAWHVIGGRGYYYVHREHYCHGGGRSHFGMLDRWKRGDFSRSGRMGYGQGRFGGSRSSSTRNTVNNRGYNQRGSFSSSSASNRSSNVSRSSGSFGNTTSRSSLYGRGSSRSSGSFGNTSARSSSSYERSTARSSGSFGNTPSRSSSSYGRSSSHSSGSFGSSAMRSSSMNRSSVSHSSGSFGGSRGGGSFSGGASHSSGSSGGRGGFGRGR